MTETPRRLTVHRREVSALPVVIFSSAQRRYTNDEERIEVDASRVDELIGILYARFPDLEGKLDHIAVSIDGVVHNQPDYVRLPPDAEVHLLGAVAGGSGDAITVSVEGVVEDALSHAQRWNAEGRRVALATVVETWGSSPCPAGSQLVVDSDGRFEGSVSGGCVESAVVEVAGEVMDTGDPRLLEFGIADADAWAVGLACGGRVQIFVERLD